MTLPRAKLVLVKSQDRQPSARLREQCPEYRIATEILIGVADLGCSGDIYDYIWSICQREHDRHIDKPLIKAGTQ